MIYVGIDWSSQYNDICILGQKEEKVKEFRIEINDAGFQYLLEQLRHLSRDKSKIVIGIETDKNILADYLLAHGYTVYSLNPLKVNRFKERYSVSAKKDDKFDAASIALFLLKDKQNFNPIISPSPECEKLRLHCETLDQLTRDRTRLINRIRNDLSAYFPAFLTFFLDLNTSVPMNVLKACAGPAQFKELSEDRFLEKLKNVKFMPMKRKLKLYNHLKAETIHFDSPRESALMARVLMQADRILEINSLIAETRKKIINLYERHELALVFSSLPGAGETLAPKLLTLFGDNRDRFQSYKSVQCYAGTAPVTERSGKSFYSVKMRRACNKAFKDTIYQFAFCSLSQESWAALYYRQLRNKGQSHSRAIRALSNKWLKIIFRMWKDCKLYERNIFIKKRENYLAA